MAANILNTYGVTNVDATTRTAVEATIAQAKKEKLSIEETKSIVKEQLKNAGMLTPVIARNNEWLSIKDADEK